MAGMLPGVECARRRRFHQSGGGGWTDCPSGSSSAGHGHGSSSSRRSSFCLYTSNNESHFTNISSMVLQRSPQSQAYCDDEKLGVEAREAKERLDGRLRSAQWKSQRKRYLDLVEMQPQQSRDIVERSTAVMLTEAERAEAFGMKNKGSKRFNWAKLSWKSSEQDECAVCLEQLKENDMSTSDLIMQLPCAHRFHSKCLVPWLHNNSHCPCCRLQL